MGRLQIPGHARPRPGEVTLDEIRAVMGECGLCPLAQTRGGIVFGRGNPRARVMLVGEAPSASDEASGEALSGASGRVLAEAMAAAGLDADDVYVTNVTKCRVPANRPPAPGEIEACAPYLREQLRSVWPDVIVCLGNVAAQFVLRCDNGVTRLRGRMHEAGHFRVAATFHPAATIYNKDWAPLLVEDLRMVADWLAAHPAGEGDGAAGRDAQDARDAEAGRG